jgi:hypothetical protein
MKRRSTRGFPVRYYLRKIKINKKIGLYPYPPKTSVLGLHAIGGYNSINPIVSQANNLQF